MRLVIGTIAITVALVAAIGSVAAFYYQAPNVVDPEVPIDLDNAEFDDDAFPLVPPRLVFLDDTTFQDVSTDDPITAPDGRPVAQFDPVPASLFGSIGVHFSEGDDIPSDTPAFTILASVQYRGEHSALITTSRQSGVENQAIVIGDETVVLDDGSKAWASAKPELFPDAPNELVFVRDGLIITLVSGLSVDELVGLASNVIVVSSE